MNKLTIDQIQNFMELGYVKIENAFSEEIAHECCKILWETIQLDPQKPETWTKPVIWINELGHEPFVQAANTDILLNAYTQLAGDNWLPRTTLGSFPIRFPSNEGTNDTGWHVDASFAGENPSNYLEWKINISSKGRALLMLFLFSDVSELDAPTRILEGSHVEVTKILKPFGENGLTFMELAQKLTEIPQKQEILATGKAGTVYLCHPFLVHAAQQHKGTTPKFMAQPALLSKGGFIIKQPLEFACPVEKAVMDGI